MKKKTKAYKCPFDREVIVNVGAWKIDVVLVVGDQRDQLDAYVRHMAAQDKYDYAKDGLKEKCDGSVQGQMFEFPGGGSLIWMKEEDTEVLVHEIFHSVFWALNTKGVRLSRDSEEAFAYLIEYLFSSLKPKK